MTFARPSTRAVAATLIAAAIGIVAPACSSGGSDAAKAPTTTAPTTTTAPATTTAAPTTTAAAPVGLPDQEAVAQKLYDAWKANDKATAATVADQAAIDNFWPAAPGDYSLYNSCSTGEFDTSGCLFRGANGTIQVDLEKRGDNWVVSGAFWSAP
jgi:hypothetical protein